MTDMSRLEGKMDRQAEVISEVRAVVGRLEAAADQREKDEARFEREISELEGRLLRVESNQHKYVAWVAGAATVLGGGSAFVGRLFM